MSRLVYDVIAARNDMHAKSDFERTSNVEIACR